MTQRQAIHLTKLQLLELFRETFPEIYASAVSTDITSIKVDLHDFIKKASTPKDIIYTLKSLIDYDGSIVNMGVKNPDGSVCYIIGVLKAIRNKLKKHDGDMVHVVINTRD